MRERVNVSWQGVFSDKWSVGKGYLNWGTVNGKKCVCETQRASAQRVKKEHGYLRMREEGVWVYNCFKQSKNAKYGIQACL